MTHTQRSHLFKCPPHWQGSRHGGLDHGVLPPAIASWLFETGSLTQRLRAIYGTEFRVVVLGQEWAKPWREESLALKLRSGQRAIVREVALQAGDQPLVMARSVIPARTLRGADRRLANLGTKPLGHILFSDPRLRRLQLRLTRVKPADWQSGLTLQEPPNEPVWGRRSLYSLGPGHKLLVAEFFLPLLLHRHEPA